MIRKKVLWARSYPWEELLEKESREQTKLTPNISYYLVFQNVKEILKDLHISLKDTMKGLLLLTSCIVLDYYFE